MLNIIEYNYVFKKPYINKNSYFILFGRLNFLNYSRIGFQISKKNIKYAHLRNYIKRLIREKFRLYQFQFVPSDFIIVVKKINSFKKKKIIKNLEDLWVFYYDFLLD